jgi:hypothetical protein
MPRVLDGDDGLSGKRFEKRNLLIRKRMNFGASKLNCSDRHPCAQQRRAKDRPVSQSLREGASFGKFLRLSLKVSYVDRPSLKNDAACDSPTRARESNADI